MGAGQIRCLHPSGQQTPTSLARFDGLCTFNGFTSNPVFYSPLGQRFGQVFNLFLYEKPKIKQTNTDSGTSEIGPAIAAMRPT